MEQIFDSIYNDAQATVEPKLYFLAIGTALLLGICVAQVYRYKNLYSRDFVFLIAILPALISSLIFLVNGNLGSSVAVAGIFSLIRFRSAAGGARELLSLFVAMGIGLATGMGYLILAILSTAFLLGTILVFETIGFAKSNHSRRRLNLTIPADVDYDVLLEVILLKACQSVELISIKNGKKNKDLSLDYMVDLKSDSNEKYLIQELIAHIPDSEVLISKVGDKKKSL